MIEILAAGEYQKTRSEIVKNAVGKIILIVSLIVAVITIIGSIVAIKSGFYIAGVMLVPAIVLTGSVLQTIIEL